MQEQRASKRQLLLITSLIFGLFFGAGNLIFPVQLGQLAGGHVWPAISGFLLTGALLPFLAMLGMALTKSTSVFDIAKPVAPWFATIMVVAIHFSLGPLFATPRTAATAFAMGIAPLIPTDYQQLAMLIFSAIFFLMVYRLTLKESNLTKWVGKYLNPLFLILLAVILLLALIMPMGGLDQKVSGAYKVAPAFQGILEGYNTMDCLALLAFAVSVVYAVKNMGFSDKQVPKLLAKSGLLAILLESLIYIATALLGVTSLGIMPVSDNGGTALSNVIIHYTGNVGILMTGLIVTLAVFTTAMGLSASFSQDLHKVFPKISYKNWLRVITVGSFITANAGLTKIIAFSIPALMIIYPFTLALTILAVLNKWVKQSPIMYRTVMAFITIPALLDGLLASPAKSTDWALQVADVYHAIIPLAAEGFGWVLPAIIGALVAMVWQAVQRKQTA
ncbi:branched-chain amino acid transport system II carrier protein [Fructobacillus fructosus]|uniref:Branched-chain amino acid transport system carrier protein n=1 Tax=Fructobacillus fructosus TaxID=1631 RepID=A0ABN9YKG2_9LACO|nr:branched-chain amino acid transport system II carrier protein [Fructobacillus fructosus]MBD9364562.1 branched-chain amino acid transport system II carrier protein [Leuconostoc mesenteroides]MBC9118341.1 branched-chain amino acid transport system II carrier protein [Fructobacillus fructosus]MCK8638017.1 branched-chain amino acid transport system II carrier protein [Fructobacillus fructosus]CAK1228845.1 Branched-chain amino acid permease (BrnQ) [Fructobacillus fructosus]CAK1228905.1 Branched-